MRYNCISYLHSRGWLMKMHEVVNGSNIVYHSGIVVNSGTTWCIWYILHNALNEIKVMFLFYIYFYQQQVYDLR